MVPFEGSVLPVSHLTHIYDAQVLDEATMALALESARALRSNGLLRPGPRRSG